MLDKIISAAVVTFFRWPIQSMFAVLISWSVIIHWISGALNP